MSKNSSLFYYYFSALGTNQEHARSHRHALNLTNLPTADGEPMVELSGIKPLTWLLRITSCAASSKVVAGGF